MSLFGISYLILWVLVGFETLTLVLVFREIGVIYLARRESFGRDGPDLGRMMPALAARTLDDGQPRTLADLRAPVTAFVFGTVGCNLCKPAVHMLERWSTWFPQLHPVLLVEEASGIGRRHFADIHAPVWVIPEREAYRRYAVRVSPYVVLVDSSGKVLAKGLVNHNHDVKRLLRSAAVRNARPAEPTRVSVALAG